MRISTAMMHNRSVNTLMKRQADMAKAQDEVSTGLKVQKPSDDPAAAVQILQLQQQRAAAEQFGKNINSVKTRLEMSELAMADAENVIRRVAELGVQANSAALDTSDKRAIAIELSSLNQQLMAVANRKDANGEFLFSGYASGIQPFTRPASGSVTYAGDQSSRNVQIGPAQYLADGDSGQSVFMSVPEGNGTFVLSATSGNAGTGVIAGAVQNSAAWIPDDYTLSFTTASTWQVVDGSANVVASGAYSAGTAINFNGVSLTVTGTPAAGDGFSIEQSRHEDIFTTIDQLISTLNASTSTQSQKALFQNDLGTAMTQLSQAETHVLNVRAGIGARVSILESVDNTREDEISQYTSAISALRDADATESISRFSQQYTALQAAQQAYARIAQLSLFNYL